jgi:hypothetical protein
MAKDAKGRTSLMLATRFTPTAVASMLDVIKNLTPAEQAKILMAKAGKDKCAFKLLKKYHPEQIDSFVIKFDQRSDSAKYLELFHEMYNLLPKPTWRVPSFFSFGKRGESRKKELMLGDSLPAIIHHAAMNNDMSRTLLVSLGWMDEQGTIPGYAPPFIKASAQVAHLEDIAERKQGS